MFFKTNSECSDLARDFGFPLEEPKGEKLSEKQDEESIQFSINELRPSFYIMAKKLVPLLGVFRSCLLWVTEFGIWPSHENRHLYYRLRASYGDLRELKAAPGHYFLEYETADLTTFLALSIQFCWGIYLLESPCKTHLFLSHDGVISFFPYDEYDRKSLLRDIETISWLHPVFIP